MDNLADVVLDHLWFLEFSEEDEANADLTLKMLEHLLSEIDAKFTAEETAALRSAATRRLAWYQQEPDEHGFTPRKLLTVKMKEFLERIAAGNFWGPGIF